MPARQVRQSACSDAAWSTRPAHGDSEHAHTQRREGRRSVEFRVRLGLRRTCRPVRQIEMWSVLPFTYLYAGAWRQIVANPCLSMPYDTLLHANARYDTLRPPDRRFRPDFFLDDFGLRCRGSMKPVLSAWPRSALMSLNSGRLQSEWSSNK